jgi:hypothetical protein
MEKIGSIYCAAQASNRRYPAPRLILDGEHIGEESRPAWDFKNWTKG